MTQIRSTLAVALIAAAATSASAVTVNLTANNAIGASSFNANLSWSPAGAPSAGNDYVTQGFLLRTPSTAGSYTFAGDSLLVGGGVGGGAFTPGLANNNAFLNKTPTGNTITVNNLILNGSSIRDGQSSVENWTLAGGLSVVGVGGNLICQETFNLNSTISGSAPLYIGDFGNTDVGRVVKIGSSLNTYNGTITMMGTAANRSRLTFIDNSLMNFTIGASGINNAINRSGALSGTLQLDGDFAINLSGAGNTIGDNWLLVDNANLAETFSTTFTVAGFSDIGGDLWQTSANGATYQFSEGTGILSVVPEPGTASLLALGAMALFAQRRARRA
jgi:hypothetical protein